MPPKPAATADALPADADNLFRLVTEGLDAFGIRPEPDDVIEVTAQTVTGDEAPPDPAARPSPRAEPTPTATQGRPAAPDAPGEGFSYTVTPADVMAAIKRLFAECEALDAEVSGWAVVNDTEEWQKYQQRAYAFLRFHMKAKGTKATEEDWRTLGAMQERLARFRADLKDVRAAMMGAAHERGKPKIPPLLWIPIGIGAFLAAKAAFGGIIEAWGE